MGAGQFESEDAFLTTADPVLRGSSSNRVIVREDRWEISLWLGSFKKNSSRQSLVTFGVKCVIKVSVD